MIGMNGPNFVWADQGFTGSAFTQDLDNDLRYRYGPVPMLWRLRGKHGAGNINMTATWQRCKERGVRTIVAELLVPNGPLPTNPDWWVDEFGGDIDTMLAEGLYPIIEPGGEGDLDHAATPYAEQAKLWWKVRTAIQKRWPLFVIPNPWAQDAVRTPQCVAAYDELYREAGVITWHYYAVTRADQALDAPFTHEWIAARYPNAQIIVAEWGIFHDQSNPNSPVWTDREQADWILAYGRRLIAHPQVALSFFFLPYGTEDWSPQFLNTEAKREAMRVICNESRAARIWPRYATVPGALPPATGNADLVKLRDHMSAQNSLAEANIKILERAGDMIRQALGYSEEMDDRVQGVWDDYQLGAVK
jgi:hypothetical protein